MCIGTLVFNAPFKILATLCPRVGNLVSPL